MSEYADQFRDSLAYSMAESDQVLSHLRDDDSLLDHLGEIANHTFTLARELRMVGASHIQVFSLVQGTTLSAVEQAFDVHVPGFE